MKIKNFNEFSKMINESKNTIRVIDSYGKVVGSFDSYADAILFKKGIKDSTGMDYEIEDTTIDNVLGLSKLVIQEMGKYIMLSEVEYLDVRVNNTKFNLTQFDTEWKRRNPNKLYNGRITYGGSYFIDLIDHLDGMNASYRIGGEVGDGSYPGETFYGTLFYDSSWSNKDKDFAKRCFSRNYSKEEEEAMRKSVKKLEKKYKYR